MYNLAQMLLPFTVYTGFVPCRYQRALEWGIHIVSYNWLLASAAAGHLVPEQDYTDDGPDAWNPSPAPPARQQSRKQQLDAATPAQTGAWLAPIQTQQLEQERQGSSNHGAGAKDSPVAAQEQQSTADTATASSSATGAHEMAPLQHRQQQVVQSASTPASSSNSRSMQLQSTRPDQAQHGSQEQQQDPPAANISSSSSQAGTRLFTFASELPPNFLLLGSDSPRSEEGDGASFSPLMHFSLSQVRPDQQQQQVGQQEAPALSGFWTQQQAHQQQEQQQQQQQEQVHTDVSGTPSQLGGHQAPAVANGGGSDGSVQEFHFHMHSHDTPQQHVSPCMQSFLPMLQQQEQEVVHGLSPAGGCSTLDRLQLADHLAGSELQPDGVLDLPLLLPEQGAAAGAAAQSSASVAAVLPAAAVMTANEVPAGCAAGAACSRPAATAGPAAAAAAGGGGMLIPETQFEEELGLVLSAAAGRGCGLQLPCKTPDSLAHYVNKQRRRQKALAPAWDDSRTTSQHSHHYEQQQQQQQQQQEPSTHDRSRELAAAASDAAVAPAADCCPPGGDAGAASGAAWPPSWLQRAAAARELVQQQQLHQDAEQPGCDSTAAPAAVDDDDGWPCADSTCGEEQEEPDADQLNQQGVSISSTRQQDQQEEELRQPKQQVDPSADRSLVIDACTGDAAVKDTSSRGRPWSSSSSSTSLGLVRLKRRDGYRRQAGRVLMSSPPPLNPADLAELEDSDCDIADVDADVSDDSYDCRDDSAADAAGSDDLTDEQGNDCADGAGARRRLQHGNQEQQQRCEDISCKLTAKASAAAAALAAAFAQADGRQQPRPTVPRAAAVGGHLAPAAAVDGRQQQEQLRHKSSHLRRHALAYSPVHSCSGSSLPTGSCRATSAAAAAAAAAAAFADSEDDEGEAFHSAASASSQPSGSLLTDCSSQGALPVMRLNFSLGNCGSSSPLQQQQTPAGSRAQQQQEVQQHEDEAGEEVGCGECSETETECSGSQERMGDAAWSPDSGSLGNSTSANTSSSSRQSTSSSGTGPHSNASSRFRLKQRSAAAGGTAATAAALMQKRQALKQQEQQQQQASRQGTAFVTPASEGSQFVTRRKCPRPTTDHAAGSSTAAAAESTAQQPFYPGAGAGTGAAVDAAAAADAGCSSADAVGGVALQQGGPWDDGDPAAALSGLSDADDTEVSDVELHRGVHSGAAGVPAAEQLMRDLKQRQQDQQQQQQGIVPGAGRKKGPQHPKQQQPAAADAFLRDLRLQQQQQQGLGQGDGSMAVSSRAGREAIDPATQAPAASSAAAGAAAACWRSRSSAKPRLSVTSSSCADTQLTTASHKVPLGLQGGGIILHSCSASSSSSICTTGAEDGLAKALHKALADTAAVGPAGTLQGPVLQQQELNKQRQEIGDATGASADVGHQQEPLTSFSSSEVGALQYQQQQPCGASLQQGQQQAEQQDVSWLHTPEDPQQQQKQQQQGSQVDLVGMSTVGVAARGAAMSQHLGARLAQLSQAQEEVGADYGSSP